MSTQTRSTELVDAKIIQISAILGHLLVVLDCEPVTGEEAVGIHGSRENATMNEYDAYQQRAILNVSQSTSAFSGALIKVRRK